MHILTFSQSEDKITKGGLFSCFNGIIRISNFPCPHMVFFTGIHIFFVHPYFKILCLKSIDQIPPTPRKTLKSQ